MAGFRTAAGQLSVGGLIGRGGEGEVFAVDDGTGRALKVYASPDASREAKVRAMVADGLARFCPEVAFPEEVALGPDGAFAGFTMRRVGGCHPIHELYAPGSRRDRFPRADWRFLVRAATNLARIFGRVHATGSVIGDVNGAGVLVSDRAVVTLIDADSFQRGPDHLCRVGVPEYTPPELQGRRLDGVRTVDHDAFGLAVLVFQLLFLGRHPFAGVAAGRTLGLADAIRRGWFAYTDIGVVGAGPPPETLRLADLPAGVRLQFERAFLQSGSPRPSPDEWAAELARLEAGVARCPANDRHALPTPGAACPWCRLERRAGTALFGTGLPRRPGAAEPRPLGAEPAGTAIRSVVEGTVRRARAASGEAVEPRRLPADARPSGEATELRRRYAARWGADGAPTMLALDRSATPFLDRHRRARDTHAGALDAWRVGSGAWRAAADAARLADRLGAYVRLLGAGGQVVERAFDEAVREKLAGEPLPTTALPGIGPRRRAALAAAGVLTAADATRARLGAVPGLGERERIAVLLWRSAAVVRVARELRADVEAMGAIGRRAARAHRASLVEAERTLGREAGELEGLLDEVAARARAGDRAVDATRAELARAAADLDHLGLAPDAMSPPDPAASRLATGMRAGGGNGRGKGKVGKKPKATSCPNCGSPMVRRSVRATRRAGFILGCVRYPTCRGLRPIKAGKP